MYRIRSVVALTALLAMVLGLNATSTTAASAADTVLSQGRPVTASSTESAGTSAAAAVDGDAGTRRSSQWSDPQWIHSACPAAEEEGCC